MIAICVLVLSCETGPEVVNGAVPFNEAEQEVLESSVQTDILVSEDSSLEVIHTVLADDAKVKEGWETQIGRFDGDALAEFPEESEVPRIGGNGQVRSQPFL